MKRSHVFLALLGLLLPSLAHADLTVKVYQELLQGSPAERTIVQNYVGGVAKGYLWANIALAQKGQSPLFCFKGDLDTAQANQIAAEALAQALFMNLKNDTPVEMLLLLRLQKKYPCAPGKTP